MNIQNLDQRRAKHALERVNEQRHALSENEQSKYLSYAKALPATILQNGLGQATATLLAAAKGKETDPHAQLYQDLQGWLCGDNEDAPYRNEEDLLQAITRHDQKHYLRAQAESQQYLSWLKKLAAAYLGDAQQGQDDA